jgi:hypothetical protein
MTQLTEKSGAKNSAASTGSQGNPLPPSPATERQRWIAEAAYYRAEHRGFSGGDPVEDWLAAEAEIDQKLSSVTPQQQKEELAAYDQLRQRVKTILAEVQDTVNAETIKRSIESASKELKTVGQYTSDTVNKVATTLKKDLASTAEKLGPKWDKLSERTAGLFDVWRDRGSDFLSQGAAAASDWLKQVRGKLGHTYRAGEMTHGGTFVCTSCGKRVVLQDPAHLPSCPRCHSIEYRRV